MKGSSFQKYFDYMDKNKSSEITDLKIGDVKKFVRDSKEELKHNFNLNDKEVTDITEEIRYFLRAKIIIKYCKDNEKELYEQLLQCNNVHEINKTLNGKLPKEYNISCNINKHIIRQIRITGDLIENSSRKNKVNSNNDNKNVSYDKPNLTLTTLKKYIEENISNINSNLLSSEELHEKINLVFKNSHNISSKVIDEYISKYVKLPNYRTETTKDMGKLMVVDEESDKIIKNLKDKIEEIGNKNQELEEKIEKLTIENESLNKDLREICSERDILKTNGQNLVKNLCSIGGMNIDNVLIAAISSNNPPESVRICKHIFNEVCEFFKAQNILTPDKFWENNVKYTDVIINLCLMYVNALYNIKKNSIV